MDLIVNLLKAAAQIFRPVINVINKAFQSVDSNNPIAQGFQTFTESVNQRADGGQAQASESRGGRSGDEAASERVPVEPRLTPEQRRSMELARRAEATDEGLKIGGSVSRKLTGKSDVAVDKAAPSGKKDYAVANPLQAQRKADYWTLDAYHHPITALVKDLDDIRFKLFAEIVLITGGNVSLAVQMFFAELYAEDVDEAQARTINRMVVDGYTASQAADRSRSGRGIEAAPRHPRTIGTGRERGPRTEGNHPTGSRHGGRTRIQDATPQGGSTQGEHGGGVQQDEEDDWRQRDDSIQVTYTPQRGDSPQKIAALMGIDVDQLKVTADGNYLIPLPGWEQAGNRPVYTNPYTLYSGISQGPSKETLMTWWSNLSSFEQKIEMGITNAARRNSEVFQNTYDFAFASTWVKDNRRNIADISELYGVDPSLVSGILMSEILFDYTGPGQEIKNDVWQDQFQVTADGAGFSNVHFPTLQAAYSHLVNDPFKPGPIMYNPWIAGGGPVSGSNVDEAKMGDFMWNTNYAGQIHSTAMVVKMLADNYGKQGLLSEYDKGIIFGAYRAGWGSFEGGLAGAQNILESVTPGEYPILGPQSTLAIPVMEYTETLFE